MAFVLVSHESGLSFEALGEGLKSRNPELFPSCFFVSYLAYIYAHRPLRHRNKRSSLSMLA